MDNRCTKGSPTEIKSLFIWALPVWGGGLNPCRDGLWHLFLREMSMYNYRGGKHYENFRVPQILLVESIFRCFGQKITPVGRFWVPFQQYQKFGFPYYRAKKSCCELYIWVSKPIRRKIQNQ